MWKHFMIETLRDLCIANTILISNTKLVYSKLSLQNMPFLQVINFPPSMKELTTSRFMSLIIILDLNEVETTQNLISCVWEFSKVA